MILLLGGAHTVRSEQNARGVWLLRYGQVHDGRAVDELRIHPSRISPDVHPVFTPILLKISMYSRKLFLEPFLDRIQCFEHIATGVDKQVNAGLFECFDFI